MPFYDELKRWVCVGVKVICQAGNFAQVTGIAGRLSHACVNTNASVRHDSF